MRVPALLLLTSTMLLAPAARAETDPVINLVCVGQGEMMGTEVRKTLEWDRYDHKYRVKNGYETRMKDFESAVTIQIYGNDGRIRLPRKLIPPIHAGGDDQHWWQLQNVSIGSDEIRASYQLNGVNKPRVKIDRTSGLISIKGFGQEFEGRCDKIDEGSRRF